MTGANGAGKTNLLEALHVGTQGFSPRTRADQQLVRFGASGARIALAGDRSGRPVELEVTLQHQAGKRAKLNGAPLRSAEQLRARSRDARLHAGSACGRQGWACRPTRVLRSNAEPAAAEPGSAAARVCGRGRAAECSSAAGLVRCLDPRRDRAVDRAGRRPRRGPGRVAAGGDRAALARLRGTCRGARATRRRARLHGRAADVRQHSRLGSSETWNGA